LPPDGFLNLLKPPGMSSHDAVAWLRRVTATPVGHAGSLDRAAAGVLVLALGKARRLTRWALESDKEYIAEVTFGITTDTLDAEGRVLGERDASALTAADLERVLPRFTGDIEQRAPAYSAVHAGGERLYRLARQGLEVPVRTRMVRISSLRLLDFTQPSQGERTSEHPRARVAVECSKGTYIRSLAADVGDALGCGAYLSFLVRTRSGAFSAEQSVTIEETQRAIENGCLGDVLAPMDAPLSAMPVVTLGSDEARLIAHGTTVPATGAVASGLVRVYDTSNRFIGVGDLIAGEVHPRVIVV
jgi:tRNA pseudouridine55 synthase